MLKIHQNRCQPEPASDPAGEAHGAPPDPLVDWGGASLLPRPHPRQRRIDSRAFGAQSVSLWWKYIP